MYVYMKHIQSWSVSLAGLCRFSCVVYYCFRHFSLSKEFLLLFPLPKNLDMYILMREGR